MHSEMSGANINNGVFKIYATGCECSKASGDSQQKLPKPDMRGVSWRYWRLEPRVDIDAGALLIQIPPKDAEVERNWSQESRTLSLISSIKAPRMTPTSMRYTSTAIRQSPDRCENNGNRPT